MTMKPRRRDDATDEDHRKDRKTIWLPLSESTPVKLGFVVVLIGAVGSAVYWAATMEAQAATTKGDVGETKKAVVEMTVKIEKGMKEISNELKNTTKELMKLMHKQELILQGTKIEMESIKVDMKETKHRCDRIEMRQIKIIKEKDG